MSGKSPRRTAARKATKASPPKRSQPETLRGRALGAALTVKDLIASVAWYRNVLGFIVGENHLREGKLVAVSLKAGAVEIVLSHDDGARGLDRVKGEGMSLQITTAQDVDELAARVTANGGAFVTPPTTMPWGPRVFRVQDPDGFKWVVSSPRN